MKRILLLPIIFSQALTANAAWVSDEKYEEGVKVAHKEISSLNDKIRDLCPEGKPLNLEDGKKHSNRLWREIVEQVNNARIKYGFDESVNLTDRSEISIGKDTISEATSSGKYLGIDKWKLAAGVTLFNSEYADLGVGGSREVTYIQQFPTRWGSICRLGYDPITKIPLNSKRALEHLKPGDFVAFSSPLTLSLGKSLKAVKNFFGNSEDFKSLGGVSIYASGEFNIHVYRMENNYVRVRFFAAKTKGGDFNPGVKFYVLGDALGLELIKGEIGMSLTNLFSADYVFNLNDAESRTMYDKVMGEKFELKKVMGLTDAINPFASDKKAIKTLFSDLEVIEAASIADLNKDLEARRVIRLSKGETETTSKRYGIGFNLRIAKARHRMTYSDSLVSFFDVTNENQKYTIKTISEKNEFNFFDLWGQENNHNTAMLVRTDDNYNPVHTAGLQNIRVKEELSFSKDEMRGLKSRLNRLPEEIRSILNLPDPDKLSGDIAKARIEQSIFLDTQALESQESITHQAVKEELKRLILSGSKIDSEPVNSANRVGKGQDTMDPRAKALDDANLNLYWKRKAKTPEDAAKYLAKANSLFMEAFSHELELIPNYLSGLFGKEKISKKLEYYNKLQEIPLFNEMGVTLVLNLISQADQAGTSKIKMKDTVSYRLSISGRGIEPKISEYPAVEKSTNEADAMSENLKKSEIFQRILNDNAYMTDRSFNLRYYMNEKGESYSLKEIVARSTGH